MHGCQWDLTDELAKTRVEASRWALGEGRSWCPVGGALDPLKWEMESRIQSETFPLEIIKLKEREGTLGWQIIYVSMWERVVQCLLLTKPLSCRPVGRGSREERKYRNQPLSLT